MQFLLWLESLLSILYLMAGKDPRISEDKYLNISKNKEYVKTNLTCKEWPSPLARGGAYTSLRAISTARLRTLLHLHLRPINVVVSHGPLKKSHLVVGFALICFQRLSLPDVATQRCPWRDNWCTSGRSNPVLSY